MFYGTVVGGQAHWDARGYSGTVTEELLTLGSSFVDSVGWRMQAGGTPVSRFPGRPASLSQELQWPREGASSVYGYEFADDEVPDAVVRATYEAAWYQEQNPEGLNIAVRSDQRIAREQYGDVMFSYFPSGTVASSAGIAPTTTLIPSVMTELASVLAGGGNPYGITGVVA